MRRRALLTSAALTIPVAGCSTGERTTTQAAPERRISIVSTGDPPRLAGIDIEATMIDPVVDSSSTAKLRVDTTVGEHPRRISVDDGRCAVFNRRGGRSADGTVRLIAQSRPGIDATKCEQANAGWRITEDCTMSVLLYICGPGETLGAGTTITNEVSVWDTPEGGYMPTGTHEFEHSISVRRAAGHRVADFDWTLTLRVSSPDGAEDAETSA